MSAVTASTLAVATLMSFFRRAKVGEENILLTLIPALKRWAKVKRPLRGRQAREVTKQKAAGVPAAFLIVLGRMTAATAGGSDYVPVSQLVMYSICSAVSVSIEIPSARSLRLAIS